MPANVKWKTGFQSLGFTLWFQPHGTQSHGIAGSFCIQIIFIKSVREVCNRVWIKTVLFSSINNLQLILTALCWGNNNYTSPLVSDGLVRHETLEARSVPPSCCAVDKWTCWEYLFSLSASFLAGIFTLTPKLQEITGPCQVYTPTQTLQMVIFNSYVIMPMYGKAKCKKDARLFCPISYYMYMSMTSRPSCQNMDRNM